MNNTNNYEQNCAQESVNENVQDSLKDNHYFDFDKAQHLSDDIYNLVVVLDGYCKNKSMQYAELDCISTTVEYLRQNSAKLSCMFMNYKNNEEDI